MSEQQFRLRNGEVVDEKGIFDRLDFARRYGNAADSALADILEALLSVIQPNQWVSGEGSKALADAHDAIRDGKHLEGA